MSADHDGDSQMISSASSSSSPATPPLIQQATSDPTSSALSPPDSQHRGTAKALANANGKRPLNTISNGPEDDDELIVMKSGQSQAKVQGKVAEFPTKTDERTGYSWSRKEDEPGYAWANKKALDESRRAFDNLVQREFMVKGRYGDPFEMADQEQAKLNSLKQK